MIILENTFYILVHSKIKKITMGQVEDICMNFIIHNYLLVIFGINENADHIFKLFKQNDHYFL